MQLHFCHRLLDFVQSLSCLIPRGHTGDQHILTDGKLLSYSCELQPRNKQDITSFFAQCIDTSLDISSLLGYAYELSITFQKYQYRQTFSNAPKLQNNQTSLLLVRKDYLLFIRPSWMK